MATANTHASALPSDRTGDAARRPNPVRLAGNAAVVLAAGCAVALLFPVIAVPIVGDDRYWYAWIGARADGSVLEVVRWSFERLPELIGSGRLNVITGLERRLAGLAIIQAAVATSTPIVVYLALLKLALFAGGVLTCVAFVRSLRWRAADGRLISTGRRTLLLAGVGGMLAVAVGAQVHREGRNGWTSYPVSTYSATISIFGAIALLLWLTRLVAERSRRMVVVAVAILVVLAVITNFRYELVFAAVPIAAVALTVVPVTGRAQRSAGRRAKLITGLAYFGTFLPVFVAIRVYLANACAEGECYVGVQMNMGTAAVRTTVYNLLGAVPGSGGTELLADLREVGWADRYTQGPTSASVLVGLGAVSAMLLLWWASGADVTQRRDEGVLLVVAAGLTLLVALGTAAIMAMSEQSQELITEPGILHRNVVVTWTGLAFGAVLAVLALGALLPRPAGLLAWFTLALMVGTIGMLSQPGKVVALRAHRISYAVTDAINWEMVQGATSPGSDARRCDLFELARTEVIPYARLRLYGAANAGFERYHGQPFCSDPQYPDPRYPGPEDLSDLQ